MPLEAVCVVLDNSEFNRNGDFAPSRWESQEQAATNICDAKLQQNPENTVAVMSQAGNRVELHITQSREVGDILTAIAQISINGRGNFMTAVKVAALSLKHRINKNAKPRVIIFCGHPLEEEQSEFERLGKRLRQNNVGIDVINFANPDNVPKLQALVDSANKNDNSHFLDVPLGVSVLTDILFTSPILLGDEFGGMDGAGAADGTGGMVVDVAAGGPAAGGLNQFGDLANDPELAQALRISMDEERARQNDEAKAPGDEGAVKADAAQASLPIAAAINDDGDEDSHDEEYYIEQAKKLSLMDGVPEDGAEPALPEGEPPKLDVDIKEAVNTDFMKGLVEELGLDLNQDGLGDLGLGDDEEEKKDGDNKDGKDAAKDGK